jgi:lysophospholipase L1-like esterase
MDRRNFIKTSGIAALSVKSIKDIDVTSQENKATTVLFQGDSITEGGRWMNSTDWNHIMGQSYAYIIAGELGQKYPSHDMLFCNRGISGNTSHDLADRWTKDTIELKPDILSILVGVNDAYGVIHNKNPKTAADFEVTYRQLLERTKNELPGIRLVMMEPFILPVGQVKDNLAQWQAEIAPRQAIVQKLAAEYNTLFIPLQSYFTAACKKAVPDHWVWDGIHPMPAGHYMIAQEWIKAVRKRFSFPG